MAPKHPYRRLTDHLFLVSDALLLTVVADALLIIAKNAARIPAAWIDPMTAFVLTMALGSMIGAEASWFLHRRAFGARGMWMLAAGLVVAAPALVMAHSLTALGSDMAGGPEPGALVAIQILGLVVLMPPLVAGVADLVKRKARRLDPIAIVRVVALAAIVALITIRFLPETQADAVTAHTNAMLGLSTIAGALAVGVADAIRLFADRRTLPPAASAERPTETA
jgi:hypothetical protein